MPPQDTAPNVPVPFASDAGKPESAEDTQAEERRYRREIATSVALHLLVPALLVVALPVFFALFGSGRKLGGGQTSVEVALLSAVPGEEAPSEGQVAALPFAPAASVVSVSAAREVEVRPQEPAPSGEPPRPDELGEALAAARAALEKRAPGITAESSAKTFVTWKRSGAGDGIGQKAEAAGGNGSFSPAALAGGAKGYGFGVEGDGETSGDKSDLESERRAWRQIVAQKVNKYTLRRPTNRALYPPRKPLFIHLSYFPDGTLREVTLRPPSSTNPGPEELAFLRHTATNIEQAQPLPKPNNPKLLEKGLDLRSFILPGY